MYKSIKIYTRTRCHVSVYRTTGPLVYFSDNLDLLFKNASGSNCNSHVDDTPVQSNRCVKYNRKVMRYFCGVLHFN